MNDDLDNTLVECPNTDTWQCSIYQRPKEFEWFDETIGQNNYCPHCGSVLVPIRAK